MDTHIGRFRCYENDIPQPLEGYQPTWIAVFFFQVDGIFHEAANGWSLLPVLTYQLTNYLEDGLPGLGYMVNNQGLF